MNDKDFDKSLSEKLNEEIKWPYNDTQWVSLSGRLDKYDESKRKPIAAWWLNAIWLAPLLLLLAGSNFWFYNNLNKTQTQNDVLIKEMEQLKALILKRDTIVKERIITKTDTIYIERKQGVSSTLGRRISEPTTSEFISNLTSQNTSSLSYQSTPSVSGSIFSSTNTQSLSTKGKALTSAKTAQSIDYQGVIPVSNTPSNSLKEGEIKEKQVGVETETSKNLPVSSTKEELTNKEEPNNAKKPIVETTNAPKPEPIKPPTPQSETADEKQNIIKNEPLNTRRFYIGTNGGILYYHTSWFNKDNIEIFKNKKSYQVGIKAEYALNNHWRILSGFDFCPFDINITWYDKRYNLPSAPAQFATSTDFKLKSLTSKQTLYQGLLGVKHIFNGRRIAPYLGLAYAAMKIPAHEATFVYQKVGGTYEHTAIVSTEDTWLKNIMMLNGGLEYRLGKRWLLQGEGYYYKDINKTQRAYSLFGARGAILFGF